MPNRLIHEKSPYLLQHAHNPVDWRPWGQEALAAAREQDKPVFLSIGYSTCHWCHVMERESFEHPETAALLNAAFVCVKVDREERPDLDAAFMAACQMLTGQGGWPLTLLLTPEGKPFFAATYLPRESRFGRMGLVQLTERISELWSRDRARILDSAGALSTALRDAFAPAVPADIPPEAHDLAFTHFRDHFDPEHGGFGPAPKFPSPHQFLFLLRHFARSREPAARDMARFTLRRLRHGGLFDQVGLGFHRYSTDREWLVPHFEKMLYDQALLLAAYAEAFQAFADPFFARVCREIAAYLQRDLAAPGGAFFAAEDADSEGQEGRFYVWSAAELRSALGEEQARFWSPILGATEQGNFRDEASGAPTGHNILHFPQPLEEAARARGLEPADLEQRWEAARAALLDFRARRPRPARDNKVLADWNGLAVAGLALAGRALGDAGLVAAAGRAADFVLAALRRPDGRLLHRYCDGEAAVEGLAEDYAFLAWGLTELHQATLDPARLEQAASLADILLADFWDPEHGGLFQTSHAAEELPLRPREAFDAAIPSANSVALTVLARLFRLTGRAGYEERASALARAFGAQVATAPFAHAMFLCGLDLAQGGGPDVRFAGDPDSPEVRAMRAAINARFAPDLLQSRAQTSAGPLTGIGTGALAPAALVCRDRSCAEAAHGPEQLLRLLGLD